MPADVRAIAAHDHRDVLVLKRLYQRSDERPTTRVGDASSYSHGVQTIIADGHDESMISDRIDRPKLPAGAVSVTARPIRVGTPRKTRLTSCLVAALLGVFLGSVYAAASRGQV